MLQKFALLGKNKEFLISVSSMLASLGIETEEVTSETFASCDCSRLLVVGQSRWASKANIDVITQAKSRGIPVILWQFEPLLPPGLGPAASKTRDQIINLLPENDSLKLGLVKNIQFWFLGNKLLLQTLGMQKMNGVILPHPLLYPARQCAGLISLKKRNMIDHVLVSLVPRKEFLQEMDIESHFVPVGSVPSHGRLANEVAERDVDVLFLGRPSSRRMRKIRILFARLKMQGYRTEIRTWGCLGEERTRLVNRSKVLLNVNKFPWELPGMRPSIAMRCGAAFVSEWAEITDPYVAGEHFVMAQRGKLYKTILNILEKSEYREAVARRGYEFVHGAHCANNVLLERVKNEPKLKQVFGIE